MRRWSRAEPDPAEHVPVAPGDGHDRVAAQVDAVEVHHVVDLPVHRAWRPQAPAKLVAPAQRAGVYFVKLGCTASSLFLDGVGACFGRCRRFGVPSVLLVWLFHE